MHQLIVIRGKIDEEIVNTTDNQGILFIPSIKLFYKKKGGCMRMHALYRD